MERIAGALGDLKRLYHGSSLELPAIDAAIATGTLVLIEAEQEAHWEGKRIDQRRATLKGHRLIHRHGSAGSHLNSGRFRVTTYDEKR